MLCVWDEKEDIWTHTRQPAWKKVSVTVMPSTLRVKR